MAHNIESDKGDLNKINKFNGRILRNRQYKRPLLDPRPTKRLFTPEIKRHLKSWLVRRRENPYPNREEKIELAAQTGLTYIQICNWFANWRRKLKNSGKNINKFTWSNLIKSYNDQAMGNVEHLSISSNDSIWDETDIDKSDKNQIKRYLPDNDYPDDCPTFFRVGVKNNINNCNLSCFSKPEQTNKSDYLPQCFQISSTSTDQKNILRTNNKCRLGNNNSSLLTKWKKSAALFQPNKKKYSTVEFIQKKSNGFLIKFDHFHGREELDAAEALTFLSRASSNNL
ncbi:conserved hypothetical protein [Pediculus humanus corporis]|uniref:Homeobox domain-containing protein n=1 Tax=Pediculus humanus subsp. corporis TaxID=121224 RepID=E0VVE7_PEDHC|nr:uncharacterized protein Phum_PHUM462610 [Pediculus humanus corporis]EEB17353.1 conserved hypothetical protein [Pediculus humanus corporis]